MEVLHVFIINTFFFLFSNRHSYICPQIATSAIRESEPKAFSHIALVVIFAVASCFYLVVGKTPIFDDSGIKEVAAVIGQQLPTCRLF